MGLGSTTERLQQRTGESMIPLNLVQPGGTG
jgi:hypothetical protein